MNIEIENDCDYVLVKIVKKGTGTETMIASNFNNKIMIQFVLKRAFDQCKNPTTIDLNFNNVIDNKINTIELGLIARKAHQAKQN